ncbi:MAG TPA: hypothetical protein VF506_00140 [Streptosporangiaceae bacterium]
MREIPEEDRLARAEWLELLTLASRDPSLPVGRRIWASWMAGEMVAAHTVKAANLLRGVTGA